MLRGPLHNRNADSIREACGKPFPCPDGIARGERLSRARTLAQCRNASFRLACSLAGDARV